MTLVVSVPEASLAEALADTGDVRVLLWALDGPAPAEQIDLVVLPYALAGVDLSHLEGVATRLVQAQTLGYDNLIRRIPPGQRLANAVGVHEGPTAELAVALALASLRGIDDAVTLAREGRWEPRWRSGLFDARVVLVGYGGIGRAIAARLEPFGARVTPVARHARDTPDGPVHSTSELPALLPDAGLVVLAVPLTPDTDGLVDARFLAAMADAALLVNVARGPVVDTAALVDEVRSGRLRAALDVVDPEPLPADHPLWTLPGVILTPHVGGLVTSMGGRIASLVREQIARLARGDDPLHVVAPKGALAPESR